MGQRLVSRPKFFEEDKLIEATLTTDYNTLVNQKKEPVYQPAVFTWHNADSSGDIQAKIKVRLRGNFRRAQCSFASMMFDFDDSTKQSRLNNLNELKIVVPCEWGSDDEQWVIREYLVYKIYQLLSNMSYRVRLIRFKFDDNSGTMKPYKQYGFALEPIDDLAKRNKCIEVSEKKKIGYEDTDRAHTTMVSIFQYMIGNSDWVVSQRHNIKMLSPKASTGAKPFIVPYDFDYCGAVNALYADPAPHLKIEKVTDRLYLGNPRTLTEVKAATDFLKKHEEAIYKVVSDFELLKKPGKEEMINYLKEFFQLIQSEENLQKLFVEKGRGAQGY